MITARRNIISNDPELIIGRFVFTIHNRNRMLRTCGWTWLVGIKYAHKRLIFELHFFALSLEIISYIK